MLNTPEAVEIVAETERSALFRNLVRIYEALEAASPYLSSQADKRKQATAIALFVRAEAQADVFARGFYLATENAETFGPISRDIGAWQRGYLLFDEILTRLNDAINQIIHNYPELAYRYGGYAWNK